MAQLSAIPKGLARFLYLCKLYPIRVFLGGCGWALAQVRNSGRSYAKFSLSISHNTMAQKLYVGGLPYSTTDQELADAFAQAGSVVSASIVTDRMTGRSRGFGFVEMASEAEGTAAIDMWHGKEFGGRTLTVNVARPKEERPAGGGDRGDRRGGGGGGWRDR